MSVLSELERLKLVSVVHSTNSIRLLSPRGRKRGDAEQSMAELARLLADFVSSVNQRRSADGAPVFFSFKDSMLRLPEQAARFDRVFSSRAAALLDSFDQWIASQPRKADPRGPQTRVGLGVYLVHHSSEGAPSRVVSSQRSTGMRRVKRARPRAP